MSITFQILKSALSEKSAYRYLSLYNGSRGSVKFFTCFFISFSFFQVFDEGYSDFVSDFGKIFTKAGENFVSTRGKIWYNAFIYRSRRHLYETQL